MKERGKIPFFSFGESLGIFGFLLLILGVVLFRELVIPSFIEPMPIDTLSLCVLEKDTNHSFEEKEEYLQKSRTPSIQSFKFNANKIKLDSLMLFGFDSVLAKRYLKFREAFSGFDSIAQLRDLYGLDSQLAKRLDSFAFIARTKEEKFDNKRSEKRFEKASRIRFKEQEKKPIFNLNTATYEQLITIRGVGDFYADQIIKYRRKLGGFVNDSQLMEVYGMDSSLQQSILANASIDTTLKKIQKLDVNNLDKKELRAHPYCTYLQAEVLVNYRKQHGNYKRARDILKTKVFSMKEYQRLEPYLLLE